MEALPPHPLYQLEGHPQVSGKHSAGSQAAVATVLALCSQPRAWDFPLTSKGVGDGSPKAPRILQVLCLANDSLQLDLRFCSQRRSFPVCWCLSRAPVEKSPGANPKPVFRV